MVLIVSERFEPVLIVDLSRVKTGRLGIMTTMTMVRAIEAVGVIGFTSVRIGIQLENRTQDRASLSS